MLKESRSFTCNQAILYKIGRENEMRDNNIRACVSLCPTKPFFLLLLPFTPLLPHSWLLISFLSGSHLSLSLYKKTILLLERGFPFQFPRRPHSFTTCLLFSTLPLCGVFFLSFFPCMSFCVCFRQHGVVGEEEEE